MLPLEVFYHIFSLSDGFERENVKLVCNVFNDFIFYPQSSNPHKDREVSLMLPLLLDKLCKYGHMDLVKHVLHRNIFTNDIGKSIYKAAKYGHDDILKLLSSKSTSQIVAQKTLEGLCRNGSDKYLEYVLKHTTYYYYYVIRGGNMNMIRHMLNKKGFGVYSKMVYGACVNGNSEIIDLTLSHRKDYNEGLLGACRTGNIDLMHRMLSLEIHHLRSALQEACKYNQVHAVRLLLDRGAVLEEGAITTSYRYNSEQCIELLSRSMNISKRLQSQSLKQACIGGHLNLVKQIMETEIIDIREALFEACSSGHLHIAEYFIDDLGRTDSLHSGLLGSAIGGHIYMVKYMISRGAIQCDEIFSAACMNNKLNMAKYLIDITKNPQCGLGTSNKDISQLILSRIIITPPQLLSIGYKNCNVINHLMKNKLETPQNILYFLLDKDDAGPLQHLVTSWQRYFTKKDLNKGLMRAAKKNKAEHMKVFIKGGADNSTGAINVAIGNPAVCNCLLDYTDLDGDISRSDLLDHIKKNAFAYIDSIVSRVNEYNMDYIVDSLCDALDVIVKNEPYQKERIDRHTNS